MTTKTLNGKEILVIEVSDDAYDFEVYNKKLLYTITQRLSDIKETTFPSVKLPEGQWSILGRAKDITEEQARQLVEENEGILVRFRKYPNGGIGFKKALESFQSWLKAEGIKETDLLIIKNS